MKALTTTLLGTVAGALAFLVTSLPNPATAQMMQPTCAERATVLTQLATRYKEQPVNTGLTNTGAILEVLALDGGSWTVLLTNPQGITCMMAAGQHWEPVEPKRTGFSPSELKNVH